MSAKRKIDYLTIEGFQSIRKLDRLPLNDLNVLIGANGAGKSNFVSYFRMLGELVEQRLQVWVSKRGSADRLFTYGVKETAKLTSLIQFGAHHYTFTLEPTLDGGVTFVEETAYISEGTAQSLGSGHLESKLKTSAALNGASIYRHFYDFIASLRVFHFHDTSDTAGVKRRGALHDNQYLRPDASNLAAYLYRLREQHAVMYDQIRKVVQLAIPFFDDFVLTPEALPSDEYQIALLWKQRDSDYALWPSQLSDGSIRFICLVTTLMQPDLPSTIVIDEPELGLHPYALTLLGSLIRSASKETQVIISTQSVRLLNEFEINDLIVVEREHGVSTFKRLDEQDFQMWLEDYSIGDLWEKNVLGGRPTR